LSTKIEAYCQGCGKRIPGKDGVVHAVMREIGERQHVRETIEHEVDFCRYRDHSQCQHKTDQPIRGYTMSEFLASQPEDNIPAPARWQVHCNDCNPHPATEAGNTIDGLWCEGCYWWSVDRCQTWADVIHWQRHLSEKNWFTDTDWSGLLEQLDDPEPSGLRFAGAVQKAKPAVKSIRCGRR
jgi:hypothetical protein